MDKEILKLLGVSDPIKRGSNKYKEAYKDGTLVSVYDDGTLIAEKLNVNDHLTRLATASITEELNDTLHGAQYRTKWTPSKPQA